MFGLPLVALVLALTPFTGPPLPGSLSQSAKFSVSVSGRSGQAVHLRAVGVPHEYVASFCTSRVCAPFAVTLMLPRSGRASIELQLIENVPGAVKPKIVTVTANGSHRASIAFSQGAR